MQHIWARPTGWKICWGRRGRKKRRLRTNWTAIDTTTVNTAAGHLSSPAIKSRTIKVRIWLSANQSRCTQQKNKGSHLTREICRHKSVLLHPMAAITDMYWVIYQKYIWIRLWSTYPTHLWPNPSPSGYLWTLPMLSYSPKPLRILTHRCPAWKKWPGSLPPCWWYRS